MAEISVTPVPPFARVTLEGALVRATLRHDPAVVGVDVGLYLDGSGSMADDYHEHREESGGGLLYDMFGWGKPASTSTRPSVMEPQARWLLEYLASKDRNGCLRVAYWSCGADGRGVQEIGELGAADAGRVRFAGPRHLGQATMLAPALADYLAYFREQVKQGAREGCCLLVTDGAIQDEGDVVTWCAELTRSNRDEGFPRIHLLLVAAGEAVDGEQLDRLAQLPGPASGPLWRVAKATDLQSFSEAAAAALDSVLPVSPGACVRDAAGNELRTWHSRLPAVLEFPVPPGCRSFAAEIAGITVVQPLEPGL